jgi:hypothetical protein
LDFHGNEKILKKIRGIGKFPIDKKKLTSTVGAWDISR